MTDPVPLGRRIASGRAADVFDVGDGRVLRRYRDPAEDTALEARVMRLVADHGVAVPTVHDAVGPDIVMDFVAGPTMLDDLTARPWKLYGHARTLARLQAQVAKIPAPDWLMAPGFVSSPDEDRVLHLDLHPMNVIISPDGPVIIDWTNAAGGPPGFDAAMSQVLMSTYEVEGTRDRLAQRAFVGLFRRERGSRMIDAFLVAAVEHRLADRAITPGERVAAAELRRRVLAAQARRKPPSTSST